MNRQQVKVCLAAKAVTHEGTACLQAIYRLQPIGWQDRNSPRIQNRAMRRWAASIGRKFRSELLALLATASIPDCY